MVGLKPKAICETVALPRLKTAARKFEKASPAREPKMSEEMKEWAHMWGAKVKLRNDMPDDMLRDAIETAGRVISEVEDFEVQGLACAEAIKTEFDARWSPHWHCVIGRNFGSFVTHETKNFIFFYLGDKAVMLFKAG